MEPEINNTLQRLQAMIGTTASEPGTTATSGSNVTYCPDHRGWQEPCQLCAELAESKRKAKQAKVDALMPNAQVGKRYHGMTFADYLPTCKEGTRIKEICERYAQSFNERLKNCDSLLMIGNPGTGKNMLAACICRAIMEADYTALHTTAIKLVRKIKESWVKNSQITEQQAINQFLTPDLLVIDEIGVQFGSETEKMYLSEVISDRHENMRPTILLSNLTLSEVEKYLGVRAMDRFHEGKSTIMQFTWESYRRRSSATG